METQTLSTGHVYHIINFPHFSYLKEKATSYLIDILVIRLSNNRIDAPITSQYKSISQTKCILEPKHEKNIN
jgi:hypothetical protein